MRKPLLIAAALALPFAVFASDRSAEPLIYDLVINGESFTVEANREIKLQSRKQPDLSYQVALRIAQIQRLVLNSLQFDYDRGFRVTDDHDRTVRTATLRHELGFTMIVSDLGRSYDSPGRQKAMDALTTSLQSSLSDEQAQQIKVTQPPADQVPTATVKSQQLRYVDKTGSARTSMIYILGDARYTCSCIVQFLDDDANDVLPLVKTTLGTLRSR